MLNSMNENADGPESLTLKNVSDKYEEAAKLELGSLSFLSEHIKNVMISSIKKMPSKKGKRFQCEKGMNPAYSDLEHAELCPNEKRIWVLRADHEITMALGIKNAYQKQGNTSLLDKIDSSMHSHIDWNDDYGHPSLAVPELDYDGSVYYAGWLYRYTDHIQLILYTGRYQNQEITLLEKKLLEQFIAMKLITVYGQQNIVFFDYDNNDDINFFLKSKFFFR